MPAPSLSVPRLPARRFPVRLLTFAQLGAIALLGVACKDRGSAIEGTAPPPVPSAAPGACRGGGGTPSDPVSAPFFAREVGGYCIDPNGETRAYGAESKQPLDQVCLEQFNGECEIYKGFGLDRVVTLRYVSGGASPGEVNVVLARFATKEGAYGFFSRRVLGTDDPQRVTTRVLDAGGAGAIGTGEAYVWRGLHVAQLTYSNTDEPRDAFGASSERVLPTLAKALGERVTGDVRPPKAVALLPPEARLRHGASYAFEDVLGLRGAGGGAVGYYADGERRYRIVIISRGDAEGAEDVFETFAKVPGAEKDKLLPFPARHISLRTGEGRPKVRWSVAQSGTEVVAVGDEEHVLGGTAAEDASRSLSRDELVAKLRETVAIVAERSRIQAEVLPAPTVSAGAAAASAPAASAPAPAHSMR